MTQLTYLIMHVAMTPKVHATVRSVMTALVRSVLFEHPVGMFALPIILFMFLIMHQYLSSLSLLYIRFLIRKRFVCVRMAALSAVWNLVYFESVVCWVTVVKGTAPAVVTRDRIETSCACAICHVIGLKKYRYICI